MPEPGRTAADFLTLARPLIDRLDARLLLQHVCGLSHAQLIASPQTSVNAQQWRYLQELLQRRAADEPLAYLVGHADFRGRRFTVSPDVLIPRPETEELVELALRKLAGRSQARCVDLGTGSGVIAISLQLECPSAEICAVDVSAAALKMAGVNAAALQATVDFRLGSWLVPLAGETFDLIVANPPYVAEGDPHMQLNGLPYEPQGALSDGVAGGDGMACIGEIVPAARAHLLPGGWLIFEHGYDQGAASRNLLAAAGFEDVFTQTDLAGTDRISGGRNP